MSVLLLWLLSLVTPKPICITDLILLQKKALDMQNTIMQKSEFSKMRDCSGFLQIGSHLPILYPSNLLQCMVHFSDAYM